MKNFIKDKTDLLQKGFLIKPVESKKSLKYINNHIDKGLL